MLGPVPYLGSYKHTSSPQRTDKTTALIGESGSYIEGCGADANGVRGLSPKYTPFSYNGKKDIDGLGLEMKEVKEEIHSKLVS